MQDAFSIVLNHSKQPGIDYTGIFDGHGPNGENIAAYASRRLCDLVVDAICSGTEVTAAIRSSCLALDKEILNNRKLAATGGTFDGGSTALAAWMCDGKLHCLNLGDSRMVVSVAGTAVAVTSDHKPFVAAERKRITRAGGFVRDERIMSILGVARAFGDFVFKTNTKKSAEEQMVTACPDVFSMPVVPELEFVVLASDGLWDFMGNQQVIDYVRGGIERFLPLDEICSKLLKITGVPYFRRFSGFAKDNQTVIILVFR